LYFKSVTVVNDSDSKPLELIRGDVQVADVFSTNPYIKIDDLVPLADPSNVFIAENIVPLVYKPAMTPAIIRVLNAVSAELTTNDLLQLDKKIIADGEKPATVARTWLRQAHLS